MEGVPKDTKIYVICEFYDRREYWTCVRSKGLSSLEEVVIKRQQNHKINKFVDNCHIHENWRKDYVAKKKIRLFLKKKDSKEKSQTKETCQTNDIIKLKLPLIGTMWKHTNEQLHGMTWNSIIYLEMYMLTNMIIWQCQHTEFI